MTITASLLPRQGREDRSKPKDVALAAHGMERPSFQWEVDDVIEERHASLPPCAL